MISDLEIEKKPIQAVKRIGKGGEGEVWTLGNDPDHAIKLYTIPDPAILESKVRAMIAAQLAEQASQVAFPVAVVTKADGRFAGFLMRLVREHKPIHELYSPGSRKIHFPRADYRFLVRSALNVARAIGAVHQLGCIIGDINHSSILVSQKATVNLIDSDSFQVSSATAQYLCRVAVPEYTPPELQGVSLENVVRTANHDAFGMAVLIFQLLFMGRHPFMGTIRKGDPPSLPDSIKAARFAYSEIRDVGLDQPPGTSSLSDFPPVIAGAFEVAFSKDVAARRPTASQWVTALQILEKSLVQCEEDNLHWYPGEAEECPWCCMDKAFGMSLFVPYVPPADLKDSLFDPGESGFNLDAVWRQIETTGYLNRSKVSPSFPQTTPARSAAARTLRLRQKIAMGSWGVVVLGAVGLWIYDTNTWFLDLVGGGFALKHLLKRRSFDATPLIKKYEQAERDWMSALDSWYERIEIRASEDLFQSLQKAKAEYASLPNEEASQRRTYVEQRRAKQLHAYLEHMEIRNARIKGIGPAKLAALLSFGIETAADVQHGRVLAVPGFGPSTSQGLLRWKAWLEARFVYSERANDTDRLELGKIRAGIQGKAARLRRTLLAGASNLNTLISRTKSLAAAKDNQLMRVYSARAQSLADLESLGIPKPAVTPPPPKPLFSSAIPTSHAVSPPRPQPAPRTYSGVACPRCGSAMVRRTAHKGAYAGRQFWGCSRYPVCKGTRN